MARPTHPKNTPLSDRKPHPKSPAQRRSFSQANLAYEFDGPDGARLSQALRVPPETGYQGTHQFHPYPGRFHPQLARQTLHGWLAKAPAALTRPGTGRPLVGDPFMGGGTTLVEAMALGLDAFGSDLNPVAVLVARERTRPRTPAQAEALQKIVGEMAERVEALRREKRPPQLRHFRLAELRPLYLPHVFAELAQWLRLINQLREGPERETLRAVFSAVVVKFSQRQSDSAQALAPTPFPKGAVSRFFPQKCHELLAAQVELGAAMAGQAAPHQSVNGGGGHRQEANRGGANRGEADRPAPSASVALADARAFAPPRPCGVILTSPPYPGTYDYAEHHALRTLWLELDPEPLDQQELGPRRDPDPQAWHLGMRAALKAAEQALAPGGSLYLVVGDWIDGGKTVNGREDMTALALVTGFSPRSWAAIRREVFSATEAQAYGHSGKWEHLLHWTRGPKRGRGG